jgi:Protein of unknown function (DUF1569)
MDFYLQRALDAIEKETGGMPTKQLAWHRAGKWSTAEVLEHLALAFRSTSKAMERAMEHGAATTKATPKQWLATLLVVKLGYFPSGRPAPEWTLPRGLDAALAVEATRAALLEMDGKIAAAQAKFGKGVIAVHPIIGPLTARQWRKFHWSHTRHHMKQIAATREEYGSENAG